LAATTRMDGDNNNNNSDNDDGPVRVKLEKDAVRVKRERDAPLEVTPDLESTGYELFKKYPDIPITDEHRRHKRLRCVCMEDASLAHVASILKKIDATVGAICVGDTETFIQKAKDALKYDVALSPEELDEKLRTVYLEAQEEGNAASTGKKKKLGNSARLQKAMRALRQTTTALNALKDVDDVTRGKYGRLTERQVVINNKLAQIRVRKSEGGALRTTEWPDWSFLDEKTTK
jgi:hypothetical protein